MYMFFPPKRLASRVEYPKVTSSSSAALDISRDPTISFSVSPVPVRYLSHDYSANDVETPADL